jgi:hypothetical protein
MTLATFDYHWDGLLVLDETPSGQDLGAFDYHWDGVVGFSPESSAVAPLDLADDSFSVESPFAEDDPVGTVAATGGSTPFSYSTVSAELEGGLAVLKVTGTLDPDATGRPVEAGVYDSEPYYSWVADGITWYLWYDSYGPVWTLGDAEPGGALFYEWQRADADPVGEYTAWSNTTGTATVALAVPYKINASTGAIAVNDPDVLAVGDTWEVVVRVTDALSATDDGTFTVELITDPRIGKTSPLPLFFRRA